MALKSRSAARKRAGAHPSPVSFVTLGLLFLLPVFFTPGQLPEEFEFTKVSLLATGALVLAAWWIAAESSRIAAAGIGRWLRALPGRLVAAVRRDPLGAVVALMLLSAGASTIASVRPALSLYGAPQSRAGLVTFAGLATIYYASRSLASSPLWFRRVALGAGVAAAVTAAYAILQIAHLDPIFRQRQSAFEGLIPPGSTVGHANTLSAYLAMCLPLVVWLAARSRSRAVAAAWLALAVVSLFIIVVNLLQLTDLSAATSRTRAELWRSGLGMLRDHPLLGVGLDAYAAAFPPYRTATLTQIEWGSTPSKAQNDLIQILATQGLLGGLAALALAVFSARAVLRIARRGSPELRGAAIAAGASLVGYVVPNLVGFGTVATGGLAAALAGWAARSSWITEARAAEGAGGAARGAPGTAHDVRSVWNLLAGVALAGAVWYLLVWKPLRAEIHLVRAMRYPAGSPQRDDFLGRAASIAPWDPRYFAELGRSLFYEALTERDQDASWDLLVRARGALTNAVRLAPRNGENRLLLASVLSAQATIKPEAISKEEVREEFRRAVSLDPLSPVVLVAAERGLLSASLDEDARKVALRSARTYPDYALPLADLGALAFEQGRMADAADTLRLAVRRNWRGDEASAANTWNDLSRASLGLGRYQDAMDAADSALAHNPRLGQAFANKEAAKQAMERKGGKLR